MSTEIQPDPQSYGVRHKSAANSPVETCIEDVRNRGYAVLDSGLSVAEVDAISSSFDQIHHDYVAQWSTSYLESIDEQNTVRLALKYDLKVMLKVALNGTLLAVLKNLIDGTFILNQQNMIINPSQQDYNQSAWHRDLPYQHFVSSKPLAINALYCVDDFTSDNGASYVLPFSHKIEEFPSNSYISNNQQQLLAPAGSFLIIDCMSFHRGGFNRSGKDRRAINQVYTIPYIRQQINIPKNIDLDKLDASSRAILGENETEIADVQAYLDSRVRKNSTQD